MSMFMMIIFLVAGVVIEAKYHPRISKRGSDVFLHYTKAKGARNETKLFSI